MNCNFLVIYDWSEKNERVPKRFSRSTILLYSMGLLRSRNFLTLYCKKWLFCGKG